MTVIHAFTRRGTPRPVAGYLSRGRGTPVVLLHSSLGSKSQWRELMERLSRKHQVIAIDLYGYGETPFPPLGAQFGLDDEVELVESALAGMLDRGQRLHLVGHSYGGAVALRLALKTPQRVISLAMYEPTAFHVLPSDDVALAEVRQVAASVRLGLKNARPLEAAALFIDYWNSAGSFAQLDKKLQAAFCNRLPKVVLDFSALIDAPAKLEDYGQLTLPVCLMAGRASPASSRRVAELLAQTLPCCELHTLAAGHMAPLTRSGDVNSLIERFVAEIEAYPAPWHVFAEPATSSATASADMPAGEAIACQHEGRERHDQQRPQLVDQVRFDHRRVSQGHKEKEVQSEQAIHVP